MELTNKQSNYLKAALLLVLAAGMTACGSSKRSGDSIDLASRTDGTTIVTPGNGTTNGKVYAYCNEGIAKSGGFKFRMKVYIENNAIRNDLLNVKVTQVPSNFEDSSVYLQMYRWQANAAGATYLDSTPISFRILNPNNGQYLTSAKSYLRWNDVSTAASQLGYSNAQDFFNAVILVADIRDQLAQYDVLKMVEYKNTDSSQIDDSDALIPAFDADPNAYATESDGSARANVLRNLHPFASMSTQGWSVATFQTNANNFCTGL